jgi:hypothetical protein
MQLSFASSPGRHALTLQLYCLPLLQVMLYKSETTRSRVPHVSMRDIKVRRQLDTATLPGWGNGVMRWRWTPGSHHLPVLGCLRGWLTATLQRCSLYSPVVTLDAC